MLAKIDWLILVATLPAGNKAERMRLWRALKTLGCATLRDGAYLLPAREDTAESLRALADDVRAAAGAAEVLHVAADGSQDAGFRALFDRGADYGRLLDAIHAAHAAPTARIVQALRREFRTLAAIDYFPEAAQTQVANALAGLEAMSTGEPHPAAGVPRRLASADFSGRVWATRARPWVDRLASAWLIRRFIDPAARLLWLVRSADCPADALGFDFDGAAFGHLAATPTQPERVTFETLSASFGLDADPALAHLGRLVHFLDVGGAPVAEAAGIEAVLAGLRESITDDDTLLDAAAGLFDGLYRHYLTPNATHD
jgi:hypothetical protein